MHHGDGHIECQKKFAYEPFLIKYYVLVSGNIGSSGYFSLETFPPVENDGCSGAIGITDIGQIMIIALYTRPVTL
jgi:hypothetical protein